MSDPSDYAPAAIGRATLLEEARFLIPLWASYVVAVAVLGAILAAFGVVAGSIWERAIQVPRVFLLVWGIYQTALYLPLVIAHGHTRREFALQRVLLVPAYTLLFAILMAAGFVIEHVVYGAVGWPHELASDKVLFDAPLQVPWIVLHYFLTLAAWVTAGGLLGAAFYRSGWLGVLSIPLASSMVASVENLLDNERTFPAFLTIVDFSMPLRNLDVGPLASAMTGAAVYVSLLAAVLVLMWALMRDLPVRASNA